MGKFTAKNYEHLLGSPGFSDDMLKDHFKLYAGYVAKINEIDTALSEASPAGNYSYTQFSELKRREAVAFNGMRLHELYFDNLTAGAGTSPSSELSTALKAKFGSDDAWEAYFKACGSSVIGWTALTVSRTDHAAGDENPLRISIFEEHHRNGLVEQEPILIMDVYEHAFVRDFGIDKGAYMKAFFAAIDWDVVNARYVKALTALKG